MNRREFIKAALAIPAVAALPAPLKAAEELLDGITYVSQAYYGIDPAGESTAIVEMWHKAGGKIWRSLSSEHALISMTEEPYCPWVAVPRYVSVSNANSANSA